MLIDNTKNKSTDKVGYKKVKYISNFFVTKFCDEIYPKKKKVTK